MEHVPIWQLKMMANSPVVLHRASVTRSSMREYVAGMGDCSSVTGSRS